MGAPTERWSEEAAFTAIKTWLDFVFDGLVDPSRIYRGNQLPPRKGASVLFNKTTGLPVGRGWTDDRFTTTQAQQVLVTIAQAAAGDYDLGILGQTAAYLAAPGDSVTDIRNGSRVAVDALALAVTTADVNANAYTITADDAGVSLGVLVQDEPLPEAMTTAIVNDSRRSVGFRPAFFTVRFTVTDYKPDALAPSNAPAYAQRILSYMDAPNLPVVNGNAQVMLCDLLAEGGLAYNARVGNADQTFDDRGVWSDRITVDVRFTTQTGLSHDIPSLDSAAVQSVTVQET